MSNSRRREAIEVGVGASAERVRRMFPFLLMNCSSKLGVNAGPSPTYCQYFPEMGIVTAPFDFGGRRRMWSKARSPCRNRESFSFLGESKVSL